MWYEGLKQLRIAIRMPSKELAEKIGKSPTYISRLESGAIQNTSYDTVLSMAMVIAESDAIVNGEVDLNQFDSDFSKLVFGCRYQQLKYVYDFAKENKYVEECGSILKYMNEGDRESFRAVGKYRSAVNEFERAKSEVKNMIKLQTGQDTFKEALKKINEDGCVLNELVIEIPMQDILSMNYDKFMNIISENLQHELEISQYAGIENSRLITSKDSYLHDRVPSQDEEKEIVLKIPKVSEIHGNRKMNYKEKENENIPLS